MQGIDAYVAVTVAAELVAESRLLVGVGMSATEARAIRASGAIPGFGGVQFVFRLADFAAVIKQDAARPLWKRGLCWTTDHTIAAVVVAVLVAFVLARLRLGR
jgi:hypothetical protein